MRRFNQSMSRPTLTAFIAERLGEEQDPGRLLSIMLARAFGAEDFRLFWRYWNPVYGYYLYYFCYRPLRRVFPRPLGVLLTFFASGFFLHDLPFGWWVRLIKTGRLPLPFVGIWFSLMGLETLLATALRLNLTGKPFALRVAVNIVYILAAFAITRALT
jgi:hypothetical protein